MTPSPSTVAFVGLGKMGEPMARRLVAAGHRVRGYDISEAARQRLGESGLEMGETLGEVIEGAGFLILMLPDSAAVAAVLDQSAVRTSLTAGSIVVDMSSSEPASTRALASSLATQGVALVDAPVSGGVKGAQDGTLTIMLGAPRERVDEVTHMLSALGRVRHAGDVGAGHAVKALNNLMSATHLWASSEALIAAQRFGLDLGTVLEIVNGSSGRSGSTENKWPNFIAPGSFDSGFGLRLMLKDMRIAVGILEQTGTPSVLAEAAVQRWAEAAADLDVAADHTEIARWLQRDSEEEFG